MRPNDCCSPITSVYFLIIFYERGHKAMKVQTMKTYITIIYNFLVALFLMPFWLVIFTFEIVADIEFSSASSTASSTPSPTRSSTSSGYESDSSTSTDTTFYNQVYGTTTPGSVLVLFRRGAVQEMKQFFENHASAHGSRTIKQF